MSSLMWPWPERMVSGLKPTKLSCLAVVQKKHPNPHVWAEWFLFLCPGNKNGNGKQVTFLAAQNSYWGWDNWRRVPGKKGPPFLTKASPSTQTKTQHLLERVVRCTWIHPGDFFRQLCEQFQKIKVLFVKLNKTFYEYQIANTITNSIC